MSTAHGTMVGLVEKGVVLEPHKVTIDQVRALVRQLAPVTPGRSIVDDFIADRRAEADRD